MNKSREVENVLKQVNNLADSLRKLHQLLLLEEGVDRSAQELTDGSPVTADHKEIDPKTGMQKAYVVLSDEERAKGFVRPVQTTYVHRSCGTATTMGRKLAETYARDPKFYSGTFCANCREHFPVGEFYWQFTYKTVGD